MKRHPQRSTLFPYTTLFRSYDRILGGDYIRRGHEPPLREEADAAQNHYGKKVTDAFSAAGDSVADVGKQLGDRKSTRLNSSHPSISYAVFCLKKKKKPYNLP